MITVKALVSGSVIEWRRRVKQSDMDCDVCPSDTPTSWPESANAADTVLLLRCDRADNSAR